MFKRQFRVKKQVNGSQSYKKWEDYSVGDIVIGEFLGMHICQYKKENPKLKVLDAFSKDGSLEEFIGKTLVLNSCGSLDKAMEQVIEGDVIQVEYTGKNLLQKGPYAGKEAHSVALAIVEAEGIEEVADEDTLGL